MADGMFVIFYHQQRISKADGVLCFFCRFSGSYNLKLQGWADDFWRLPADSFDSESCIYSCLERLETDFCGWKCPIWAFLSQM